MTKAVEKPSTDRCAIMPTAEEDAAERQRRLREFPDRSSGDIHFEKSLIPSEPAFPPPTVEIEIVLPPRDRPADPRMAEIAERIRIAVERMKAARLKGIVLPPLRPAAECEIEAVERLLPFKRYRREQERRARGVVDLRPRPEPEGTPKKRVEPVEDHPQFHVYVHPRLPEILAAARGRGPSVARDDGWPGQAGPSRKIGEGVAQAEGENDANAERENHADADEENRVNADEEVGAGMRFTWTEQKPKPKPRFHPNGMLIIDESSVKLLLPEPAGSKPKPKLILVPR